jgi:hypothetical protein
MLSVYLTRGTLLLLSSVQMLSVYLTRGALLLLSSVQMLSVNLTRGTLLLLSSVQMLSVYPTRGTLLLLSSVQMLSVYPTRRDVCNRSVVSRNAVCNCRSPFRLAKLLHSTVDKNMPSSEFNRLNHIVHLWNRNRREMGSLLDNFFSNSNMSRIGG